MTDTTSNDRKAIARVNKQEERDYLIRVFSELVAPLGQSLPSSVEVVLHDLAKLPNSIVAVHGDVTGRRVGDPATDLLLQRVAAGDFTHAVGYSTQLPDGRSLRSTTMILKDNSGEPVAALCLNADVSVWHQVARIAEDMGGVLSPVPEAPLPRTEAEASGTLPEEVFPRDVDELAAHLIHQAIHEQNAPVDLMRKEHKLAVVRALKQRGMFMLRDAIEMIATSLGVTRFTIYNYLNELDDEDAQAEDEPSSKRKRASR